MSSEKLSSLLDEMLEDSAIEQAAREVEEREARAVAPPAPAPGAEAPRLDDVVQLTGMTDPDLREVLGAAAPDDLLVVLAAGTEALQRRVLRNLSRESVQWIKDNLVHMGEVNDYEASAARSHVLKVANQLLAEGKIGLPEESSVGTPEAPDPEKKALRELLTDLVRIAEQSGPDALRDLASSAGEPLLREGLEQVASGAKGEALRGAVAGLRAELEQRYAQRLRWMTEALVAISEGESADAFAGRVFEGAGGEGG